MTTRRVWSGLAMAIALGAITAGGVVISQGGGGAPEGEANIWIDTNGGTCTRSASPAAYVDAAACSTFDAAWDAMSAGDTARVAAGSYSAQTIDGNKASETFIIGADKATTTAATPFLVEGNFLTLENVTIDQENAHGYSIGPGADNITFRNVDMVGQFVAVGVGDNNFFWDGGTLGDDPAGERRCDITEGEPILVTGDNATFDGITFNPQQIAASPLCDGDTFHLETIRVEGAVANLTVRNSWFKDGADAGSGHLFFTLGTADGVTFENNVFGVVNGSYTIQMNTSQTSCANWVLNYNTIRQAFLIDGDCDTSTWALTGNFGTNPTCSGTHVKNVWSGSGSCGTDTFIGGASLGLESDGAHLASGSPAIDAAETPGASDVCTGALGSVDFEGGTRPTGDGDCDAGADERP